MKKETARGIYEIMETGKWLAVGALIYFLMTGYVFGSAVCLTKHEARQLWPKKHIYWYSSDHCWSNRRGGPPTGVKYDLIRENHAEEKTPEKKRLPVVVKIVRASDYNELDAQADADLFFNAQPVPFWRFSALDDGFNTWRRRVEDLLK